MKSQVINIFFTDESKMDNAILIAEGNKYINEKGNGIFVIADNDRLFIPFTSIKYIEYVVG